MDTKVDNTFSYRVLFISLSFALGFLMEANFWNCIFPNGCWTWYYNLMIGLDLNLLDSLRLLLLCSNLTYHSYPNFLQFLTKQAMVYLFIFSTFSFPDKSGNELGT